MQQCSIPYPAGNVLVRGDGDGGGGGGGMEWSNHCAEGIRERLIPKSRAARCSTQSVQAGTVASPGRRGWLRVFDVIQGKPTLVERLNAARRMPNRELNWVPNSVTSRISNLEAWLMIRCRYHFVPTT